MKLSEATFDEISSDNPRLHEALSEAALPVDDLAMPGRSFYRFTWQGRFIGFVGCERIDDTSALLRSLVVVPAERGKGYGKEMAEWMLGRLAEQGIEDVWMITTTATDLGLGLGFVRAARERAPEGVRTTRQFTSLCPSSATLMHKSLG